MADRKLQVLSKDAIGELRRDHQRLRNQVLNLEAMIQRLQVGGGGDDRMLLGVAAGTTAGGYEQVAIQGGNNGDLFDYHTEEVLPWGVTSFAAADKVAVFRNPLNGRLYGILMESGSTVAYGGLYATADTISAGAGTEEIVFSTAMPSLGVTASVANNDLTIVVAGDYYVEISLNATLGGAAQTLDGWKMQLFAGGALSGFETIRPLDLDSSQARMGHWSAIMTFGAAVVLSVECDQDSTDTITLDNVMFMVRGVG